jgi:hypothetical protein
MGRSQLQYRGDPKSDESKRKAAQARASKPSKAPAPASSGIAPQRELPTAFRTHHDENHYEDEDDDVDDAPRVHNSEFNDALYISSLALNDAHHVTTLGGEENDHPETIESSGNNRGVALNVKAIEKWINTLELETVLRMKPSVVTAVDLSYLEASASSELRSTPPQTAAAAGEVEEELLDDWLDSQI